MSFEDHYGFFRFMKDLTVVFNTSLIKSEINTEKQGFARDSVRIMQGQSPYIVNLGLFYNNTESQIYREYQLQQCWKTNSICRYTQ
jgi:hypothetical protein